MNVKTGEGKITPNIKTGQKRLNRKRPNVRPWQWGPPQRAECGRRKVGGQKKDERNKSKKTTNGCQRGPVHLWAIQKKKTPHFEVLETETVEKQHKEPTAPAAEKGIQKTTLKKTSTSLLTRKKDRQGGPGKEQENAGPVLRVQKTPGRGQFNAKRRSCRGDVQTATTVNGGQQKKQQGK